MALKHVAILALMLNTVISQSYVNPVADCNCPDPGALYYDGYYYVATTASDSNDAYGHFPIRKSKDAITWSKIGYVFATGNEPSWTLSNGYFWAPEIHQINDNTFNIYFVAQDKNNHNILSIGVVTSSTPYGPFVEAVNKPLISGYTSSQIGYIDPHYFRDPNTNIPYLLYKYDGNQGIPQQKTPIYIQQLSDDGLSLLNYDRIQILNNDREWECYNSTCSVEAPWMIYNEMNQYYYLFYSATTFDSEYYSIGVARSRKVDSGFEKFLGPIVHTSWGDPYIVGVNHTWAGPGHCSVIQHPSSQWIMLYHSWNASEIYTGNRFLMLDPIIWVNDWPRIVGDTPSQDMQNIEQFVCETGERNDGTNSHMLLIIMVPVSVGICVAICVIGTIICCYRKRFNHQIGALQEQLKLQNEQIVY